MLEEAGITGYIPPQPNMRQTDHGRAARQRCKSPDGVGAAVERITHGEGAIAEMKRHGAGRARCRGTRKVQIQLLLAATAINLKRLISRPPAAENAASGDDHPHTAPIAARNTQKHAHRTAIAAHLQIITACLHALSALDAADSTASTTGSSWWSRCWGCSGCGGSSQTPPAGLSRADLELRRMRPVSVTAARSMHSPSYSARGPVPWLTSSIKRTSVIDVSTTDEDTCSPGIAERAS